MKRNIEPPTNSRGVPESGGGPRGAVRRPVRGKTFAAGFSLLLAGATLAPIAEHLREKPRDNFPLSYYPMFTSRRGEVEEVVYIEGLDVRGEGRPLSYKLAGAGGLNQARRQIRRIVRDGWADSLCRAVAEKVARGGKRSLADVAEVRVVTGGYNLASYFSGESKSPVSEVVHASARVERGRP